MTKALVSNYYLRIAVKLLKAKKYVDIKINAPIIVKETH